MNGANTIILNNRHIMKNYVRAIPKTISPVGNLGPEDAYYTHDVCRGDGYVTSKPKPPIDSKFYTNNPM